MIARFVGLHKEEEHMVFHYVNFLKYFVFQSTCFIQQFQARHGMKPVLDRWLRFYS